MKLYICNRKIGFLDYNNYNELHAKCLYYYWASSIANAVLKRVLGGVSGASIISAVISFPVFFLFAIMSIRELNQEKRLGLFIVTSAFYCLAFIISFIRGVPFSVMPILLMWGLIGMFLASAFVAIDNYLILYNVFKKGIPLLAFLSFAGIFATVKTGTYMMHFSFMLVLPSCICFYSIVEEKQMKYLIPLTVFLLSILTSGARGAAAVFAIFVIVYVIMKSKKILVKLLSIILGVVGFYSYEYLLNNTYKVLSRFGIQSRTIWLLINDPTHLSGRDDLANQAKQIIAMKPLFGWGVAGERIYMDNYPHNIVLEFLIDYGKPIGYTLLIVIAIMVLICLFKTKGIVAFFYTSLLASAALLFWSGSYLSTPEFWVLIFVSVKLIKHPQSRTASRFSLQMINDY